MAMDTWGTGDDALYYQMLEEERKKLPQSAVPGVTGPAASATPPWMDTKQIDQWYQERLGRTPGAEDYASHAGNPEGMSGIDRAITASPERAAYTPQEPASASPGASAAGGQTKTGWGFTSPTGGRGEFQYTPQQYGGEFMNLEGFRDQAALDADPNAQSSIKYIFRDATRGLAPSAESIATVVQRLNEQGIPAKLVGTDKIDFGNGEGPVDVIRGGTDATGYHGWQWLVDGAGGGSSPGGGGGSAPQAAGITSALTSGDLQAWLMQELQKVVQGGSTDLDQQALLQLLGMGGNG